jgi:hypothetical protein
MREVPVFELNCSETTAGLRVTTRPRVMHRPWNASAAWRFVAARLAAL